MYDDENNDSVVKDDSVIDTEIRDPAAYIAAREAARDRMMKKVEAWKEKEARLEELEAAEAERQRRDAERRGEYESALAAKAAELDRRREQLARLQHHVTEKMKADAAAKAIRAAGIPDEFTKFLQPYLLQTVIATVNDDGTVSADYESAARDAAQLLAPSESPPTAPPPKIIPIGFPKADGNTPDPPKSYVDLIRETAEAMLKTR